MMNVDSKQIWLTRLEEVVAEWPNSSVRPDQIPAPMQKLVTGDFDPVDLLHQISGVAELSNLAIEADKVTIEFLDVGGTPQQAVFRIAGPEQWGLQSLKFQCSICFGSGMNEGQVCLLCGGAGWGAS